MSDLGNVGAELLFTKGIPYLGKKAVEMGRYYGSEALRDPKLQKKGIDNALDKLNPAIQNIGSQALNQLSTKIRPKKKIIKQTEKTSMVGELIFENIYQSSENCI